MTSDEAPSQQALPGLPVSQQLELPHLSTPPAFCQYAGGPCDQDFTTTPSSRGVLLYPSEPPAIAYTIEQAALALAAHDSKNDWYTWRDFRTTGQVVFCAICKSMRHTTTVVADVTTLNLNLLFEIGFALGLDLPVVPIRDTSYIRDKEVFERLGLLDTLGYLDFQNSDQLAASLLERMPIRAVPTPPAALHTDSPLYLLKGPIETEGVVRLNSLLKKSAIRFRTYDSVETPRLSLHEARKQVASSLGVVAHLLDQDRAGALIHNARAALIAGMAMASGKHVLLLQEGDARQPIDYRDVVRPYQNAGYIESLVEPLVRHLVGQLQDTPIRSVRPPSQLLERIDIGDVAAENESRALREYFVPTAQFQDAKRGHARLVVGRKGSGKTAIFYAVREAYSRRRSHLVLDLKPEGHQFTTLRETVLSRLSPGLREHTLVAFWNYILLAEMAQKVLDHEYSYAQRDPERREAFERLARVHGELVQAQAGDFSERLLRQVERLTRRVQREGSLPDTASAMTELMFREDIPALDDAVSDYLAEKEQVWILVDNLDKGWPTRGASDEDILLLRSLLEATRRLQRQLANRQVELNALVFLRNDIYDHLVRDTPDKGKDTAILLDWDDPELFKKLVLERIKSGSNLQGGFEEAWSAVFVPRVGVEHSFSYLLARTLMRPRDLLNLLHRAIEVAVNRGHSRVLEEDISQALKVYSEDMLATTSFELRDVFPTLGDPLYMFIGCPVTLEEDDVLLRLMDLGIDENQARSALGLLVWFGFLGVHDSRQEDPRYAYEVRYNTEKLVAAVRLHGAKYVVHPAFRDALECIH